MLVIIGYLAFVSMLVQTQDIWICEINNKWTELKFKLVLDSACLLVEETPQVENSFYGSLVMQDIISSCLTTLELISDKPVRDVNH